MTFVALSNEKQQTGLTNKHISRETWRYMAFKVGRLSNSKMCSDLQVLSTSLPFLL